MDRQNEREKEMLVHSNKEVKQRDKQTKTDIGDQTQRQGGRKSGKQRYCCNVQIQRDKETDKEKD